MDCWRFSTLLNFGLIHGVSKQMYPCYCCGSFGHFCDSHYLNTFYQVLGNSAMQRKKSLPDVATLPQVTVKQGSQAMTREEISVLSSARREEIRRQLEEAERYRANPILYILNPHIRVGSRDHAA